MTICLRRFEAGVETFPHISHQKLFCQLSVPFERRVTQCSNIWQNEARNKGCHLKHNQRAWVLVSELTYLHMGSPFVLLSAVEKLMGLQGCGFGKMFVTTSSMSALVRPSPSLCIFKLFPLENALAHSSHAESLSSVYSEHVNLQTLPAWKNFCTTSVFDSTFSSMTFKVRLHVVSSMKHFNTL